MTSVGLHRHHVESSASRLTNTLAVHRHFLSWIWTTHETDQIEITKLSKFRLNIADFIHDSRTTVECKYGTQLISPSKNQRTPNDRFVRFCTIHYNWIDSFIIAYKKYINPEDAKAQVKTTKHDSITTVECPYGNRKWFRSRQLVLLLVPYIIDGQSTSWFTDTRV